MRTYMIVSHGVLHEGTTYLRVYRDHRERNRSLPFTPPSLRRFEKLVKQEKVILDHVYIKRTRLIVFYDLATPETGESNA